MTNECHFFAQNHQRKQLGIGGGTLGCFLHPIKFKNSILPKDEHCFTGRTGKYEEKEALMEKRYHQQSRRDDIES